MVLSATIVNQIRDEIGNDTDFTDADLEGIYIDSNRGNFSILVTALIVWKRRLANMQSRSFDATKEGSLFSRSQRIAFLQRQVRKYESLVDQTFVGFNRSALSVHQQVDADDPAAEFSA